MIRLIDTIQLPSYALCAVINGDSSGIEESDEKAITDFERRYLDHYPTGLTYNVIDEEPSFTHSPAFGLACDCYTVELWGELLTAQEAIHKAHAFRVDWEDSISHHVQSAELERFEHARNKCRRLARLDINSTIVPLDHNGTEFGGAWWFTRNYGSTSQRWELG